jgi:hypothetical protein
MRPHVWIPLTICLVLHALNTHAQTLNGYRAATPGARANGMGGTFIAVADDGSAAIANPGGLGALLRPQIYAELSSNEAATGQLGAVPRLTSLSFLSVAAPVGRVILAGTRYEWLNDRFRMDYFGLNTKYWGTSYAGSIATVVGTDVRLGASVSLDTFKVRNEGTIPFAPDQDKKAVSATFGGVWDVNDRFSIGGMAAKGSSNGQVSRGGAGIGVRPIPRLLIGADVVKFGGESKVTEGHLGLELRVTNGPHRLFLRGGAYSAHTPENYFVRDLDLFDFIERSGLGVVQGDEDLPHGFSNRALSFGLGYSAGRRFQADVAFVTDHNRLVASLAGRF